MLLRRLRIKIILNRRLQLDSTFSHLIRRIPPRPVVLDEIMGSGTSRAIGVQLLIADPLLGGVKPLLPLGGVVDPDNEVM